MGRVSQRGSRFGRLVRLGLNQLVFLGLRPPPPQRYPLSEAQAALQSLDDGGVLGKVVLEP
ncbi:quinone oxidoreductase [Mycobacterium tuberculosis]|uniref:Quinone oxidoreductase n=1 Tax=Mycobacterium tuberculosis TaxID=1773 RepID=A0A0U0RSY9_MYCTX|nr:quinone oxidoreductase [Mycobacterium tuberculosis variant bovis BCG]AMC88397.1 quinone oxidoreductase [Mycobacterium tuberculosis]CEZ26644.1 quinone oxidoreductase [Mycobacterium tuberculosis]CEZ30729.1 quinone oxidoreductase [Mycobacterium tuberculosis]CEZ35270.1 quinone oxidoreductase [Mycobacterium tuberculosis]